MFEFTYARRKEDPIGASKTEFGGGREYTDGCECMCIHPNCDMTISSALADRCPGCGSNPFKLGEHEVFTKDQIAIMRVLQRGRELSH